MPERDPPPTARARLEAAAQTLLLLAVASLYLREITQGAFVYEAWGDRDLLRAARWLDEFPSAGAELSFGAGARIPGAATALMFGLPMLLDGDPSTAFRFCLALAALSTALLYRVVARRFDRWTATLTVTLWASSSTWWAVFDQLWNPGFIPIFLIGAVWAVDRWVGDGDAGGLPWLAGVTALAAQLHLSALLFVSMMLPGALVSRPPTPWRALGLAALVVLGCYAPYLVHEALIEGHNTRLMFRQDLVHAVSSGGQGAGVAAFVEALLGPAPTLGLGSDSEATRLLGALHRLPLVGAMAGFGLLALALAGRHAAPLGSQAQRGVALAITAGLLGTLLWYGLDPTLIVTPRYLLAPLPAAAFVAALGLRQLVGVAWSRDALGGALASGIVGLALLVQLVNPWLVPRLAVGAGTWAGLSTLLEEVERLTGWTIEEVVARTVMVRPADTSTGQGWTFHPSLDYPLYLATGRSFPGSAVGTCAVLVPAEPPGREAPALDGDWVDRLLAQSPPVAKVVGVHPLSFGVRLVLYEREGGGCPASMTSRYALTPVELQIDRRLRHLSCDGQAEAAPAPDGVRRFLFGLSPRADGELCGTFGLAVDLAREGGTVTAALHSNQLRGDSSNSGPFEPQMLSEVVLSFEDPGGEHWELPFDPGFIGYKGALAPRVVSAQAPGPGPWKVELRATLHVVRGDRWPLPSDERLPVKVRVAERWP